MPVDNTVHIINFKVPQWNLRNDTNTGVYEEGVFEENVFE